MRGASSSVGALPDGREAKPCNIGSRPQSTGIRNNEKCQAANMGFYCLQTARENVALTRRKQRRRPVRMCPHPACKVLAAEELNARAGQYAGPHLQPYFASQQFCKVVSGVARLLLCS